MSNKVGGKNAGTPIKLSEVRDNFNNVTSSVSLNSYSQTKIGTGLYDPKPIFYKGNDLADDVFSRLGFTDAIYFNNPAGDLTNWIHQPYTPVRSDSDGITMKRMKPFASQLSQENPNRWQENTEYDPETRIRTYHISKDRNGICTNHFGHNNEFDYLFEHFGLESEIRITKENNAVYVSLYLRSRVGEITFYTDSSDDFTTFPYADARSNGNTVNMMGVKFPFLYAHEDLTTIPPSLRTGTKDADRYDEIRATDVNNIHTFTWGGPAFHDGGEFLEADGDPAYFTIPADGSWKEASKTYIQISQLRYEYLGGTTFPRYEYPHQPERNETSSDIKGFMLAGVTKVEHKLLSDSDAKKVRVERFTDAGMKQGEVRKVFNWRTPIYGGAHINMQPLDVYKSGLDYSGDVGHTTAVFILKADFSQVSVARRFVDDFESNYGVPQIISSENTANPFSLPNKQVVYASDRDVGTGVIIAYWGNVPESVLNNNSRDNVFSLGDPYINIQTTNRTGSSTSIPGGIGAPPALEASLYFLVGVNGDDDQVIIKSYADADTPSSVDAPETPDDYCTVPDDAKVISLNDQFHSGSYCTIGAVASDIQTEVSTMNRLSNFTIGGDLYELTSEESDYGSDNGLSSVKLFTETDTSDSDGVGSDPLLSESTYNVEPETMPFVSGLQTTPTIRFGEMSSTTGSTFDTAGGGAYLDDLIDIGQKYPRKTIDYDNDRGKNSAEDLGLKIIRAKGINTDTIYWPSQGSHVALNPMVEHIYDIAPNENEKDLREQLENGGTTHYWRSGTFDHYLSDISIGCDAHSIFHKHYPSRYRPVSRYANTMLALSFKWDIQRYRPPLHPQTFFAVNNRERDDLAPHVIHFGSQVETKSSVSYANNAPTGGSSANSVYQPIKTPGAQSKFKAYKDIPVMFETEFFSPYGFPSRKLPYFSGYGFDSRHIDHEGFWRHRDHWAQDNNYPGTVFSSSLLPYEASGAHQGQLAEAKDVEGIGVDNLMDTDQPYGDFVDLGYTFRVVCVDKDPLDDDCPIYELYVSNGGSLMNFEYPDGTYCRTVFNELREDNDFLLKGTESVLDNNGKRIERLVSRFKPARDPGGNGDIADQDWRMFSITLQDHSEYPRNEMLFDKYARDNSLLDGKELIDNRMSLGKEPDVTFSEIAEFHGEPIHTDVSLRFEDYPDADPTYQATHDRLADGATTFTVQGQNEIPSHLRGNSLARNLFLGTLNPSATASFVQQGIAPEVHYKVDGTRGLRFRSTDGKRKQIQFGAVDWTGTSISPNGRNFFYPTNTDIHVRFRDPNGDLDSSLDAFVRIASQDIGQAGFTVIDIPAEGYSETLLFTDTSAGPSEANYNLYGFYEVTGINVELVNSEIVGRESLTEEPTSETTYIPDVTILDDLTTIHGFKSLNQDFRGDNKGDSGPFDYNNSSQSVSDGTNPNRHEDADGEVHLSSVKFLTDVDREGFGNKDKYGSRSPYVTPIRIGNQIGAQVAGKIVTRFAYNYPSDTGNWNSDVGSNHWGYDGKRTELDNLEIGAASKFERVHSLRIHGVQPVDDSGAGLLSLSQNHIIDEIFFRTKFQGLITYPNVYSFYIQRLEDDTLVARSRKYRDANNGVPNFSYSDAKGGNTAAGQAARTQIYVEVGAVLNLSYMPELPNELPDTAQKNWLIDNYDNSEISSTDFLIVKSSKTGGDIDMDDVDANPLGIGMAYPDAGDNYVKGTVMSSHTDYGHRIYKSNFIESGHYSYDEDEYPVSKTGMLRWDTQFTTPGTYYIVYSGTDSSVDPETAYIEVVVAEYGNT
jgi:hypothetical protein